MCATLRCACTTMRFWSPSSTVKTLPWHEMCCKLLLLEQRLHSRSGVVRDEVCIPVSRTDAHVQACLTSLPYMLVCILTCWWVKRETKLYLCVLISIAGACMSVRILMCSIDACFLSSTCFPSMGDLHQMSCFLVKMFLFWCESLSFFRYLYYLYHYVLPLLLHNCIILAYYYMLLCYMYYLYCLYCYEW